MKLRQWVTAKGLAVTVVFYSVIAILRTKVGKDIADNTEEVFNALLQKRK